jgi:hypothetical protein
VPRDVMLYQQVGVEPAKGTAAAAAATSCDDAPCPTGRGSGSLASRSAVLARNATPCLAVEKAENRKVVHTHHRVVGAGVHASVHAGPRGTGNRCPWRARAVMASWQESQSNQRSSRGSWALERTGGEYESHLTAAAGQRPSPTIQAWPGSSLTLQSSRCLRCQASRRHPCRPCHYRAIYNGRERSHADIHGQPHGRHDLRRSPSGQVATLPDPALQAGGRPSASVTTEGPPWTEPTVTA